MKKLWQISCFGLWGLTVMLLGACQSTPKLVDGLKVKQVEILAPTNQNLTIACGGVKHCEFERVNSTPVIDALSHRVSEQSLKEGIVRMQGSVFNAHNQLYLSLPENQYELVVRFYPISMDRAETFHIIHEFKKDHHYSLEMYRKRHQQASASLINVSAPEPLCVVLKQEQRVIRRFCRPFNATTGLGEFVEQKI